MRIQGERQTRFDGRARNFGVSWLDLVKSAKESVTT